MIKKSFLRRASRKHRINTVMVSFREIINKSVLLESTSQLVRYVEPSGNPLGLQGSTGLNRMRVIKRYEADQGKLVLHVKDARKGVIPITISLKEIKFGRLYLSTSHVMLWIVLDESSIPNRKYLSDNISVRRKFFDFIYDELVSMGFDDSSIETFLYRSDENMEFRGMSISVYEESESIKKQIVSAIRYKMSLDEFT